MHKLPICEEKPLKKWTNTQTLISSYSGYLSFLRYQVYFYFVKIYENIAALAFFDSIVQNFLSWHKNGANLTYWPGFL